MSAYRQHHTTARQKVVTVRSVICWVLIAILLVAVCNPSVFKGVI